MKNTKKKQRLLMFSTVILMKMSVQVAVVNSV